MLVTVSSVLNITQCLFVLSLVDLQTKVREYFTITEKAPTRTVKDGVLIVS